MYLTKKTILIPLLSFTLLAGCSESAPPITSDKVSAEKIEQIKQKIAKQYPMASEDIQHQALDVAVRSLENMVFIKGGTFDMGNFGAPCDGFEQGRLDDIIKPPTPSGFGRSTHPILIPLPFLLPININLPLAIPSLIH